MMQNPLHVHVRQRPNPKFLIIFMQHIWYW